MCDRPTLIEALRGKEIVNIACGGSHSAAITINGELYTWGKGRYGRLGHSDNEDRLVPKVVSRFNCFICMKQLHETLCSIYSVFYR